MPGGFGSAYNGGGASKPAATSSGGFGSAFKDAPIKPNPAGATTGFGSKFLSGPVQQPGGSHHGVLGFVENLGSDIGSAATGLIGGTAKVAEAAYQDVRHPLRGQNWSLNPVGHIEKGGAVQQQVLTPVAKQYKATYGPLVHGDVNQFLHTLYAHPLQPILDLATVATGGAGAAAKLGDVAAKVGAISDTSRLARLGEAKDITVPSFTGEKDLIVRQTSRNPVVRGRQLAVNKGLNALPADTPIVGSFARGARVLKRNTETNANRLAAEAQPFAKAYGKLNAERQAAFHLVANGLDPAHLHDMLTSQKASGVDVPDGTLKVLANQKVRDLYANYKDDPKLSAALAEGEKLSNRLSQEKVSRGLISDTTAAESPYRALRVMNGAVFASAKEAGAKLAKLEGEHNKALDEIAAAKYGPVDRSEVSFITRENAKAARQAAGVDRAGRPSGASGAKAQTRLTVKQARRNAIEREIGDAIAANPDHPALQRWAARAGEIDRLRSALTPDIGRPIDETSHILDQPGREIPVLAKELADAGRPQPFYLPMRAEVNNGWRNGRPIRVTTNPGVVPQSTTKAFKGTLLSHGLTSFHDTLTPEVMKTARYVRRADLHDALMQHALRLAPGEALPHGWSFVKTKTGEHIGYTETIRHQFEHNLKQSEPFDFKALFSTKDDKVPQIARDELGGRLIVPDEAIHELQDEVRSTGRIGHYLLQKPTSAWKQLVLNLRPATFTNLTVGNHVLAAVQAPSLASFLVNYARHAAGAKVADFIGGRITPKTLLHVFPEQAHGSFGAMEGFGRASGVLHNYGVMRPTVAVENFLRKALVESWARDNPEIRGELARNGGDINKAIQTVADLRPDIRNEISRRVDAALGNYRTYSNLEQRIRTIVPFYGWDKHITRSVGRIVGETPHRANVIRAVGQQGADQQEQTLGPLPSFLEGGIKLPAAKILGPLNGRTPVLDTHSLDPFATVPEIADLAAALVHGKAGSHGAGELAGTINPFIQALLEQVSGRNLVTGAQVKGGPAQGVVGNTIMNVFGQVPQATLIKDAVSPPAAKPTKLYQNDWRTELASLLGIPVKKVNLITAAIQARKGY